MIRVAFAMPINPDQQEEYHRRHNPIWPDLQLVLKSHGIHNYSIFLHAESSQLFAHVEIEDVERWRAIAQTEICKRWWAHMGDIMPTNDDNSPQSQELLEVFHMD
ncbi:MAG: L-rhamnose mutarotase [Woeseiaceae bacterium]|nr:L-rhamnose mutarotase [Woeseiaceae bacterium]